MCNGLAPANPSPPEKQSWLFEWCSRSAVHSGFLATDLMKVWPSYSWRLLGGEAFIFLKNSFLMGRFLEVALNSLFLAQEQRAAEQSTGS